MPSREHLLERGPVGRAERDVVDDASVGSDHEDAGRGPARGELGRVEPALDGQLREPCSDGRGEELGARAGVLVAGAREVVETDEPDAERDREADEHDDERRERNEGPAASSEASERARRR